MKKYIDKIIKITVREIFSGVKSFIIINILMIIFLNLLLIGDISYRIAGNTFAMAWISINTYFLFALFLNKNKSFMYYINSLSDIKRYLILYVATVLINIHTMLHIFCHLIFVMNTPFINALLIFIVQCFFAFAFGGLSGKFFEKQVGLVIIGIFYIYNFFAYRPYTYDGSSHIFSINELLFSVNTINTTNYIGILLFGILFTILSYTSIKLISKYKLMKIIIPIITFMTCYSILLITNICLYNNTIKEDFSSYIIDDNVVEYKGVSQSTINDIGNLISLFENEYRKIQPNLDIRIYKINKRFLPKLIWYFINDPIEYITLEDDIIQINILSDAMINFNEPDLLRFFLERVGENISDTIDNYSLSKYTRHLIEGYTNGIYKTVYNNLNMKYSKKEKNYYNINTTNIINTVTTEHNYVRKISLLIYENYSNYINDVYEITVKINPQNDEEFIELLKINFPYI